MKRLQEAFLWIIRVVGSAAYRFYWDDCFSRASSLAYTTLFALVPVSALSFSMFNAFRIDPQQIARTVSSVLHQILPPIDNQQLALEHQVFEYITLFTQNVNALNTLSVGILFCTAIALLNTIESALNVVWRVSSDLSLIAKIINFWAVMTAGPLLIILSFVWYAKVTAIAQEDPWFRSNVFSFIDFAIPVCATWLALALLFYKLPSARVRFKDAVLGSLIAAVLFEFVKRAFATYVSISTTYSTVYGVLTSIPVFLFWLYIAWVVVLFGAEISYQAGSISSLSGLKKYATDLGEIGALLGIRVLYCIAEYFLDGKPPPSESEIAVETGSDPVRVRTCLDILTDAGLISASNPDTHSRALLIAPDRLKLGTVVTTFLSKQHRNRRGEARNDDNVFLETIRKASLCMNPDRNIEDWSLGELVLMHRN
ncbi:MAG: YihY/virulence factor BrkB family protein [Bdellovibrionota bacterium]